MHKAEGILWPPFFQIKLGKYLIFLPTHKDQSLAPIYIFNLGCSICQHYKAHYLKGWLEYHNIAHNLRQQYEQKYLDYEKHYREHEISFDALDSEGLAVGKELESVSLKLKAKDSLGQAFSMELEGLRARRVNDLREKGVWEIVYDGDILRLKRHKGKAIYALIDKTTGDRIMAKDERKVKRLKADLKKLYYSWRLKRPSR